MACCLLWINGWFSYGFPFIFIGIVGFLFNIDFFLIGIKQRIEINILELIVFGIGPSIVLTDGWTQLINFHLCYKNSPLSDSSYLPSHLNLVSSTKFLGLEIDATFSWKQHVNSLLPRLSKAFYALLTLSQSVDSKVLRQVYFPYFHSLISYGLLFWGNSSEALKVF